MKRVLLLIVSLLLLNVIYSQTLEPRLDISQVKGLQDRVMKNKVLEADFVTSSKVAASVGLDTLLAVGSYRFKYRLITSSTNAAGYLVRLDLSDTTANWGVYTITGRVTNNGFRGQAFTNFSVLSVTHGASINGSDKHYTEVEGELHIHTPATLSLLMRSQEVSGATYAVSAHRGSYLEINRLN